MARRNVNSLLGTFEKVARSMASRYDVTVVPSSACCTDGRVIRFPSNADDFNEVSLKALSGWLDHEVGHITEEDDHAMVGKVTPITILKRLKTSKERLMMNVFEDIRMETKKSQELIGVAENLRAGAEYCKKKITREVAAGKKLDFWRSITTAILDKAQGGEASWVDPAYKPYIDAIEEEIAESTDQEKTKWAEDSLDLAQRVLAKLKEVSEELKEEKERREEEKKKQEEEKQEQDESEGGAGEDGEEKEADDEDGDTDGNGGKADEDGKEEQDGSKTGADGDGEEDEASDGEDEKDGTEDGDGKGMGEDTEDEADPTGSGDSGPGRPESSEEHDANSDPGEFDDMSDEDLDSSLDLADEMEKDSKSDDLMDELKDDLDKEAAKQREITRSYGVTPEAQKRDRWITPGKHPANYEDAKKSVAPQIKGMKSKLINLIRAQSEDTLIGDRDHGELDDDALYTVKTGNRRVYTQTVAGNPLDTAVSILVDQSGSMDGKKIRCAREMTVALSETFQALGVPFEVIGFENAESLSGTFGTHLRNQPFVFRVFKAFNENFKRVKTRLGNIQAHRDNADGEALLETAKRLVVRPENRKILFVLSDGLPASYSVNQYVLQKHLRDVIEMVTGAGIEVIGIGALTAHVKDYYNAERGASHVVIMKIEKLAVEVYKVMKAQFLGRGKKRKKGAAA